MLALYLVLAVCLLHWFLAIICYAGFSSDKMMHLPTPVLDWSPLNFYNPSLHCSLQARIQTTGGRGTGHRAATTPKQSKQAGQLPLPFLPELEPP